MPGFKALTPKSLFGRTLLIVVLPIFVMQAVVTGVFFDRHWEEVTSRLARGTTGELKVLTDLWATQGIPREDVALMARTALEIEMGFAGDVELPEENLAPRFELFDDRLNRELRRALRRPYAYDAESEAEVVTIGVQLADGVLTFRVPRRRLLATDGWLFVGWLIAATVLLGLISVVFLRNQVRSITRLSEAAEAFGRGLDAPSFKPTGAREVRQAGLAFMAMRARIRRYVRQRTEMLAGVSHDLRTPLTRMKLNLALQPRTEDTDELAADVAEMERMVEDYLAFARDEGEAGYEPVDLAGVIDAACAAQARGGREVTMMVPPGLTVVARPTGLRRAVDNLVGNAVRHARTVRVLAEEAGEEVLIHVEDDGPGIPEARRREAVQAFARLDPSRGAPKDGAGGTGLGLAIVRDFARAHGGRLTLGDAALGGLRATISLPR